MAEIAREGAVVYEQLTLVGPSVDCAQATGACRTASVGRGMVLVDESADEKSGANGARVGRQPNGRMGKVDGSQVGV